MSHCNKWHLNNIIDHAKWCPV